MKQYRSMRGAKIDLAKLMARQEKNITVGNTKSNARGDQLGKGGKIVKSADELAREHYNRNDPKAVVQGGIKADDTPEINPKKAEVDNLEESLSESPPQEKPTPKTQAENKAFAPDSRENPPEIEEEEEKDPWVEDKQGNFVRQSELHQQEQNERISKPKTKHQSPKTSNKKKK